MVDPPTVGNGIVTSTAPKSSITPGVIEQTANDRAGAYGKVADDLMDVSTKLAKQQAADDLINQKVTRNADGSVSVQNPATAPLIFGDAGKAYQDAVKVGTLAQHSNSLSQDFADLHTQFPTDPAAFKAAAQAHLDKTAQTVTGPLGEAIQRQGEQLLTQHFNAITSSTATNDVENQKKSITSQIEDQRSTAIAIARQNGADSPEFKQAIEKMNLSYDALASNPLFKMPRDQIELEKKNTAALLQGEAIVAHVDDTFTKRGKAEAQKALQDTILNNPNLREVDRTRLYTQGLARLGYLTADAKVNIDANRQITTEMESGLAKGTLKPEDPAVGAAVQRARDIGDTEGAQRITAAAAVKQHMRGVNSLPDAVRNEVLGVPGGAVNTSLPPEARGLLDTIAGTESAGRYNVRYGGGTDKTFQDFKDHPRIAEPITSGPDVGKTSSAAGRYQFIGSTWDQQAKKLGLKDFSPANQDAAAWDLAQTEYKSKTGKDLLTTLKSGDTSDVLPSLSGQWSSLPGGRQPAYATPFKSNLQAADAALHLTPQERGLYERHLTNLTGPGGVDNPPSADEPQGSRSTLYQTTVEHDGKFYSIPTVWDGKKLIKTDAAGKFAGISDAGIKNVEKVGWDKFPSYKTEEEAEARYQKMHEFMDKDTGSYLQSRVQPKQFGGFTAEQVKQNPFLISAYVRTLAADPELRVQSAKQTATAVGKALDNGILPSPAAIAEVNQAATMYPEKMGTTADEMNGRLKGQQIAAVPQEQQAQIEEQYRRAADGQDVHTINVAAAALKQVQDSNKNMAEHPYDEAAQRGWTQPAAPIDPGQPDGIPAALAQRATLSKRIGDLNHTPPPALLDKDEMPKLQAALQGPAGPAVLAGIAQTLKPEEMDALLAQKPFVDSVTGMMSSKDPARMTAAMSVVDKSWRTNAAKAEASFGSAAITRLQAWQGLADSFSAPELAERLNASDDPATLKARTEAKDAAETETKSMGPADMAYKLGTGWPAIGRLTGSTPSAPFDSITGGALVADYRTTYSALRAYGVDADKASDLAVKRLQSAWGVSEAAGNQVMKNPPERSYPAIGGTHDWLQADLKDFVTMRVGPEFDSTKRTLEAGIAGAGSTRNWSVEGLVADKQTQAEIGAGRPPSYQVAVRKADGTIDIIPSRVAFDPSNHISEYGAGLQQRRTNVEMTRPENNAGMPQP